MELVIRALDTSQLAEFARHFERHRAESGQGDYHFMPFAPSDPQGPRGLDPDAFKREVTELGWQRWWLAWHEDRMVGHVDIKGATLRTALHRCELGIGLERAYRGQGLGRRLMQQAIDFTRAQPSLSWLDLAVFAHNRNARALYSSMGFTETGVWRDRFRIEGDSIDDVQMTLSVAT